MKDINEKDIEDILIGYYNRKKILDNLNKQILSNLKRNLLIDKLLRFFKLVLVCFGLPILLVILFSQYIRIMQDYINLFSITVSMIICIIALFIVGIKSYNIFIENL